MANMKIDVILFIQKGSGLPLLVQRLNPRVLDIDPALVAGFLFAIQAFSSEIIERGSSDFHIDYGKRVFTVIVGEETMAVAVTQERSDGDVASALRDLQEEFESKWYIDLEIYGASSTYSEFRSIIMERLGIQNIALSWVPYFKDGIHSEEADNILAEHIDGERTISEIINTCSISSEDIISEISRLWIIDDIGFRKTLEECDIIIPTRELVRYNQVRANERDELKLFAPEMVKQLPRIVQCFDGKTTVGEIRGKHSEEIYDLLDFLLGKGAVEILSPEKKRVLLAKELLCKSLQVAETVYSKKQTIDVLKHALTNLDRPEIHAEIQIHSDEWKIDYGFSIYDGLNPQEVMEIHDEWFEFLGDIIHAVPEKKKKKFVEELVFALREEFFDKYSSDDLDGFEAFSLKLESELI